MLAVLARPHGDVVTPATGIVAAVPARSVGCGPVPPPSHACATCRMVGRCAMLGRAHYQASNYAAPACVVVESYIKEGLVRQYASGPFDTCVVGEPCEASITSQNGAPRAQVRAGIRL